VWPDEPYAPARGSFLRPVPLPAVDPDASPTCTVAINKQWIPFIIGALQQLVLQATWKTDDPAALLLVQQRAMTLINLFNCGSGELPFICVADFAVSANPFATWSIDSGCGEWDASFGYLGALCGPFSGHYFFAAQIIVVLDNPITLTGVEMTYTLAQGEYTTSGDFLQVYILDGTHHTVLASIRQDHLVDGDDLHLTFAGSVAGVDTLEFVVQSSERTSPTGDDGACVIGLVSISGSGLDPCGGE